MPQIADDPKIANRHDDKLWVRNRFGDTAYLGQRSVAVDVARRYHVSPG